MNVFITGASGFVGRQLLEHINADSRFEKVYCLCRKNVGLPSRFTVINGALEDLGVIPPVDADVCIHLAAVTNSVTADDEDVFRINSDGTAQVVEFCKKSNISRIVFLSSINVNLAKKYTYALSKLSAEEHIRNSGLDYSVIRCSLVYGKGCESFDKIVSSAKLFHAVPVLGNGNAYEQPVYIDEVCRVIIEHIFLADEKCVCNLYGKTKMTYNEMVKALISANNTRAVLLHLPIAPIAVISEFFYRHKLHFPIQPEQISHMCEDLCCDNGEENPYESYQDEFADNLRKYM